MSAFTDSLSAEDCRALYMLLGECRCLGGCSESWPALMHRRLVDWLGVGLTVFFEGDRPMACGRPSAKTPHVIACGVGGERLEEIMAGYWKAGAYARDPLLQAWSALNGDFAVRRRQDLVPDRLWYASEVYRDYFVLAGVDHVILGRFRFGKGRHMMINFWRVSGDPPFGARERDAINRLLMELSVLMRAGAVHALSGPGRLGLSGRLRQTVDLLLAGKSEKEIAEALSLSTHTIHGYVKTIYQRLGVHGRTELFFHARESGQGVNGAEPGAAFTVRGGERSRDAGGGENGRAASKS